MSAIPQSFFNATIISAREWKIYTTKKGKREREREREMHASSVGDHDERAREKRERVNELEQKKGGEIGSIFFTECSLSTCACARTEIRSK
jgi:hypothetical protein